MFNNKKTSESKPSFSPGSTTLISQGTVINGEIRYSGNLEVEGTVNGNIYAEDPDARLRLLSQGKVEGEIHVPNVVVNGEVCGNIYASRQIQLAAKAVVKGNVHYDVIEIEKGAQVDGNFVHMNAPAAASDAPVSAKSKTPVQLVGDHAEPKQA